MQVPAIESQFRGSGEPIVLLHAFPLSHLIWDDFESPDGYSLILPDFPGFGASSLFPPGLTFAGAAQGLEEHLLERGIDKSFVLGGISMGGYWAMEYLRQFPSRVSKVILISTRPGVDKPEARQNRLNMAKKVLRDGTEYLASSMPLGLLGKTTLVDKPEVMNRVSKWIKTAKPEAVALAQRAMAERNDQSSLLSTLKVPALILAGLEDTLIPFSEAEDMSKVLPSSQLVLLERVGHLIPVEVPVEFKKMVEDFLNATF